MSVAETLKLEAFRAAADNMHVLITLSSAFIGGMVAFREHFYAEKGAQPAVVRFTFVLFGLAIVCALVCLSAITGDLRETNPDQLGSIDDPLIEFPAQGAVGCFILALTAYAYIGLKALGNHPAPKAKQK